MSDVGFEPVILITFSRLIIDYWHSELLDGPQKSYRVASF
jgi:hypothetical protein